MRAAAAGLAVSARRPAAPGAALSMTAIPAIPANSGEVGLDGGNLRADTRLLPGHSIDRPLDYNGHPIAGDRERQDLRQSLAHLSDIAELQRLELARLLDQNRRLNSRIDRLLVLQQRDHAWRERLAGTLQDLAAAAQSQAVESGRIAAAEARYTALRQSVGQLVGQLANNACNPPPKPAGRPALSRPSDIGNTIGNTIGDTPAGAVSPRR